MCRLIDKCDIKQFTGYKVALKHKVSGRYYSPAMGCEYQVGPVQQVFHQRRLSNYFSKALLDYAFSKHMPGRTSVFVSLKDAISLYKAIRIRINFLSYDAVLLKMTISDDIMNGTYCDSRVIAGRKIVEMTDITNVNWETENG